MTTQLCSGVSLVQLVRIPEPCPVSWNKMHGSRTVRYCSHCEKNVDHLSKMTTGDAER